MGELIRDVFPEYLKAQERRVGIHFKSMTDGGKYVIVDFKQGMSPQQQRFYPSSVTLQVNRFGFIDNMQGMSSRHPQYVARAMRQLQEVVQNVEGKLSFDEIALVNDTLDALALLMQPGVKVVKKRPTRLINR